MTARNAATAAAPGPFALPRAFWEIAILYGTLLNVVTSGASLAALASGAPGWVALGLHLLAVPYNIFAVYAVWRSAPFYHGAPHWPQLARIAVVVWAIVASVL